MIKAAGGRAKKTLAAQLGSHMICEDKELFYEEIRRRTRTS